VLLLVGAGVFVRSLQSVQRMDLGADADRVLAMRFEWQTPPDLTPEQSADLTARRNTFYTEAIERIAAIAGVERASAGVGSAFSSAFGVMMRVEGVDSLPQLPGGGPYASGVAPGYFATLGTPVLRGREFQRGDGAGSEPVAIVSRTMAETLWPDGDPIGRCIYVGGSDAPCSRIVGVVGDVRRFMIREDAAMQFYMPLGQQPEWMGGTMLLARTSIRPDRVAGTMQRALYEIEPSLRYVHARSFAEFLAPQRRPWTLGATLFVICGILALLIAVIGLYSVIAYLVLHRTHEIGVRMALGAERGNIIRMVLRHSLQLAGIGIVLGSVVAFLAAPSLQPLLFETEARDYAVLAVVAATLAAAAIAAGVLPALRASRVTPAQALRDS
jgi:predicted permease